MKDLARAYKGNLLSEEPPFLIEMRRKKYRLGAMIFGVLTVFFLVSAFFTSMFVLVLVVILGFTALYLFLVGLRVGPMLVYEGGIEYSKGITRGFDPWDRLMYCTEDAEGVTLRRVHGIEASMGLIDNRPSASTFIVVPPGMSDYYRVKDYILRSIQDTHLSRGTKWHYDIHRMRAR
jgi:hypothetical protein